MISHDRTDDFHDGFIAALRMLYKYDGLTAKEFNSKMGSQNAVNLLWIILDNDLAISKNSKDICIYSLTKKGVGLMKKALSTEIDLNEYDLLIR